MTDKERLDWLSTATVDRDIELQMRGDDHRVAFNGSLYEIVTSPDGLRAAIDAAMERERAA
jgi:hypothetical protein